MHTVRIRKRGQAEWLILFVIAMPFAFSFFIEMLNIPAMLRYSLDFAWLFLLLILAVNKFKMPNSEAKTLLIFTLLFILGTLIGFAINLNSPLYYLWGARNNFRFFVFFFACISYIDSRTANEVLSFFDKLYVLNFFLVCIQFFVLNKRMDYVGGLFGTEVGCNGQLFLYLCIMVSRAILGYIHGNTALRPCIVKCGMAVLCAAFAEMKFFFIVLVFIIIMITLGTRFSMKKLLIIAISGIGIYLGMQLLVVLFPQWEGVFNIESMFELATSEKGYTGRGDMNRLTTLPITWNLFLTSWPQRLFGLGLGNCDTSAFSFLNTSFYETYGFLRYNWFSSAFMFLETGIVGLGMYLTFFVLIYRFAYKREKNGKGNKEFCQLARITALLSLILIFYNASMRIEASYIIYFVLALPFIKTGSA